MTFISEHLHALKRFKRSETAVAAVEFALIAPVLLSMFFGTIEASEIFTANRKVVNAVNAVSDLTAQAKEVTPDDLDDIFRAAEEMLRPYDATGLKLVVTSVKSDISDGSLTVHWSRANANASAHAQGSGFSLPNGVIMRGTWIIVSEVEYPYASPISQYMLGGVNIKKETFRSPRQESKVKLCNNSGNNCI
ncbi:MAG: TadE/TadG family type IV pilus assembly protein [Pseudomonadota bacterium]